MLSKIIIVNRKTDSEICIVQARTYWTARTIFTERFGFSEYYFKCKDKDGTLKKVEF